jgi:hypothetical protein
MQCHAYLFEDSITVPKLQYANRSYHHLQNCDLSWISAALRNRSSTRVNSTFTETRDLHIFIRTWCWSIHCRFSSTSRAIISEVSIMKLLLHQSGGLIRFHIRNIVS